MKGAVSHAQERIAYHGHWYNVFARRMQAGVLRHTRLDNHPDLLLSFFLKLGVRGGDVPNAD
jgi:hypothetical protein